MAAAETRRWACTTVVVTIAGLAVAIFLSPTAPAPAGPALGWLLFVGSSVHVAATGWLLATPEVRRHASHQPTRYLWAPAALVLTGAFVATVLPARSFEWVLLAFFAWQFLHFQKQNLGLAALAASAHRVDSLSKTERTALLAAGRAGAFAVLVRPQLLGLSIEPGLGGLFAVAAIVFAAAVVAGLRAVFARAAEQRPSALVTLYVMALGFWAPVFVFRSPYPAVGGLVIAHGLQYLLLIGLVVAGDPALRHRSTALALGALVVVAAALTLNAVSHLHAAGVPARWLYGAYLGIVVAHFVVDAGLWRLRDSFPRQYLAARVPYLVPSSTSAADIECRT